MHLSIRTKVLATYGLLALLVLTGLIVGLTQLKRMGAKLEHVRGAYLPLVRTVDSFSHLYHLDETFDVQKIWMNRNNPMFIDSLRVPSTQLLEETLRSQLIDSRKSLLKHPSAEEEANVNQVVIFTDEFLSQHKKYLKLIHSILQNVAHENLIAARAKQDELIQQKRLVRNKLNLLTRKLDLQVQRSIYLTDFESRRAVLWATIFSVVTFVLATLVGLTTLFSLRPLKRLKEATQLIARGQLDKRVPITSKDEVGELAQEFNRMADSIMQRDDALKKQQETLIQSEKMAVVGRMAAKISHEIRNPLNAISLNIELLQDEAGSPLAEKTLQTMSREIDRLNTLTENYLSMSRSQKSLSEEVELPTLVQGIQNFVQAECSRRKIKYEQEVSLNLPKVKGDPTRLEQALINLLKNAMEASGEGKSVGLKVVQRDSKIQISIWDRGTGIPTEQLNRIFDPFFTTKEKGTGLGLSITREIVREQGGELTVESEVGNGSTFSVILQTAGDRV